jgi:hypothetical protein
LKERGSINETTVKRMTDIYSRSLIMLLIAASVILTPSCRDAWEDHYGEASMDLPETDLFGYIQSDQGLSTFGQILVSTGYDSIISASQTYTVWAPTNDALSGVDLQDSELIGEIVQNHIARGNHSTSGIVSKPVRMLNGKNVTFAREDQGYSFGKMDLIDANNITLNGQVHTLGGWVPYTSNIYEFIGRQEGLDSLEEYIYGQNQRVFDPANSPEISFDSAGNVIYDSVFILANPVLTLLGSLDDEDSIYTAILPGNGGWTEAYERISLYYNVPDVYGGAARQREKTQFAIIQDVVFRELIDDPAAHSILVSTNGNSFYSPSYLFAGTRAFELSNGMAYLTDLLAYTDTSSWFMPIRIEAESSEGRENANSNIYVRSGLGSGLEISNSSYIVVDPTGTSDIAQPNVTFSIPNTLSATYDIYCVFVPASIVDENDMRPQRATFRLTYINTTTGRTRRATITPENNVTDAGGLTKMFLERFDFEFANVIDEEYDEVAVRLLVTNDVAVEEESAGDLSRTMRIDCILLEPVVE